MNTNFAYDRMDYYSILEYLKEQASYFSDGNWSDFSDGDIGVVLLKLMAMNADTTNFQIEKGISELYLDTVKERVNAIALCKLVGYEPSHFQSAVCEVVCFVPDTIPEGTKVDAFTQFTDTTGSIHYYNIEDVPLYAGINRFKVYEGLARSFTINLSDISDRGKLTLVDWSVGTNTFKISQAGLNFTQVDNALYGEGELCFSVHTSLSNDIYIQFPTYYETILSSTTPIEIKYLLTVGSNGRIGANVLNGALKYSDMLIQYTNQYPSEGGYDPESVEDMRKAAPAYAKTMNTLVTLDDFRILSDSFDGLADVVALDYNYPESGLIQPTDDTVNDAYKVNLYMLLDESDTIIKDDDEIDESKGQYISEETFEETMVTNIIEISASQTFKTKGTYSVYSGKFKNMGSVGAKKVLVKYKTSGDAIDEFKASYSDVVDEDIIGNSEGMLSIDYSDLSPEAELSIYYENNSGYGYLEFQVFIVTELSSDPTTEYKDIVNAYMKDVKKKKPAGIMTTYYDVTYIRPHIVMNIYMDEDDLRFGSTATTIANFIENAYKRGIRKIGEALYTSHLFKDIIDNFSYINYLEITSVEYAVNGAIRPNNTEYVELLADNITVNVLPYEGE